MSDGSRLLTCATEAFVDRARIDWNALLLRAHRSPERPFFENLRELAARRDEQWLAIAPTASRRSTIAAWLIVALAAIEAVCGFGVIASAVSSGVSIAERAPQLVLAVAFAAASVSLVPATLRDPRGVFLLATFATASGVFSQSATTALPLQWTAAIDRLLPGVWIQAFIPACLWEFALDFPRLARFTSFDRLARLATNGCWALGIALVSVNSDSNLFWTVFSLAAVPSPIVILVRSRHASPSERRRVARLALAIAGGLGPFLAFTVIATVLPVVDRWIRTSNSPGSTWLYRLVLATLAATPILSTAAVIADRPFDLQGAFLRTSRYALAKIGLTAMVVAPVLTLVAILLGMRHTSIADVLRDGRARLLLSCASGGSLLLLVRGRLLSALDRRFSGRPAPDHERLGRALERVSLARGLRETLAILARELRAGLGAQPVRILVPAQDGAFVDWSCETVSLRSDGGLATLLRETATPLDLSSDGPLWSLLPRRDRAWAARHDVELAVPLKRHDGSLAAIVACGPKRGGFPFAPQDRWFATALTTAAAGAWRDDRFSGTEDEKRARSEAAFECPRCGLVADATPLACACGQDAVLAALPRRLGAKFLVERRLGAGGMGVVYLARDTTLDRDVALKTLPELRQGAVRRLRDEARAMATLNHEALATLYGLEVWRRAPVLVVEYFPNGTLAQRLANGPLPAREAAALGVRLAGALAYMHALGMLHRDVKPTNIAFSANGGTKLMDFGLACTHASGGRVAGTPAYVAPEAFSRTTPTAGFDLWALAVVILEATTGVRSISISTDDLDARQLDALPALRAFLARALARSPAFRFRTAVEFQAALEAVVGGAR